MSNSDSAYALHLTHFRALCVNHDLTFDYSDDNVVWRRGWAERDALHLYAKKNLLREDAVRIFNEVVDTKLAAGYREGFYWK